MHLLICNLHQILKPHGPGTLLVLSDFVILDPIYNNWYIEVT